MDCWKTCIRSKPKKVLKLDHSIHHSSLEIKIENKFSILKEYLLKKSDGNSFKAKINKPKFNFSNEKRCA